MPGSPPDPVAPPAPSAPSAPAVPPVPVVPPTAAELEPATLAPAEADEPARLTAPPFAGQGSRGSSMCPEQPMSPTPATKSDSVNDVERLRIARFPSISKARSFARTNSMGLIRRDRARDWRLCATLPRQRASQRSLRDQS